MVDFTAADARLALRQAYAAPTWALLFEVGDETGAGKKRSADAVAMGLWPSRGLSIEGFEIKVHRQDWLRELKAGAKAESIASKCNKWWVVAAPGVVRDGELPEGWGLLVLGEGKPAGKLARVIDAPMRGSFSEIDRPFVAALLRRASLADKADFDAVERDIRKRLDDEFEQRVKFEADRRSGERMGDNRFLEALRKELDEAGLGRHIDEEVAKVVATVVKTGASQAWSGLMGIRNLMIDMAQEIEKAAPEAGIPLTERRSLKAPPSTKKKKR